MSRTLVESLRALARHEHDDHSVADEAADELERLRGREESWRKTIRAREQEALTAYAEADELRARVGRLEVVRKAALPHLFAATDETGMALLKAAQDAAP